MFDHSKLKVGDKVFSHMEGIDVIIKSIREVDPIRDGRHTEPDGSPATFIIRTNGGIYSGQGYYYGSNTTGLRTPHLAMPFRKMFHPIVKSESEMLELVNLFDNDAEAKAHAESFGFEYVGRGNTVQVPR